MPSASPRSARRNVVTTGNLKLDVPAPPADPAKLEKLMAMTRGRPVIAAASTHPGEEEMLVETHRTARRLLSGAADGDRAAPSRPRQRDGGHRRGAGLRFAHALARGAAGGRRPTSISPTRIGELGLFYRLAPIVFMGGSLVAHGGQNPIEAIKLGAADRARPACLQFRRRL